MGIKYFLLSSMSYWNLNFVKYGVNSYENNDNYITYNTTNYKDDYQQNIASD